MYGIIGIKRIPARSNEFTYNKREYFGTPEAAVAQVI